MACRTAHSYGVYNYPTIVHILEKKLDALTDEEQQDELAMPQHQNIWAVITINNPYLLFTLKN